MIALRVARLTMRTHQPSQWRWKDWLTRTRSPPLFIRAHTTRAEEPAMNRPVTSSLRALYPLPPSLLPPSLSLSLSLSLSVVTTRCSPAIIPAVRFNSVFLTDVLRIFRRRFYRTGHRRQIRHCYASWIIDLFSQEWAITYSAVSFPAVHYLLSAIPIIIIPI